MSTNNFKLRLEPNGIPPSNAQCMRQPLCEIGNGQANAPRPSSSLHRSGPRTAEAVKPNSKSNSNLNPQPKPSKAPLHPLPSSAKAKVSRPQSRNLPLPLSRKATRPRPSSARPQQKSTPKAAPPTPTPATTHEGPQTPELARQPSHKVSGIKSQPKGSRATSREPRSTNPELTKSLWSTVMRATRGTKSSEEKRVQGHGHVARGRGRGMGWAPRGGSSQADSEAGSQTSRTSRAVAAKPSDLDFYEFVLLPRGITIDGTTKTILASTHFLTSPPPSQRTQYYRKATGSAASRVWLESDDDFVAEVVAEYTWMKAHDQCEAEFATFGKENLIRGETRSRPRDGRVWMTHRMVEVVTKPQAVDSKTPARKPAPWWSPPVIDASAQNKPYTYDIRPDCQYWLSLNFANQQYRRLYGDYVYENTGEAVCPYFTIEFKRDATTYETATNQLATAAALALHNRCILKHGYLRCSKTPWSSEMAQSIRHYGLTFTGSEYQFWCIQPDISHQDILGDWKWRGCRMSNVSRGKLLGKAEVEDFIEWVNEIHCWGMTVYGRDCEEDVKKCIDNGQSGVRTSSAITPLDT